MFNFRNKFRKKLTFTTREEMKCPRFTSWWCTLKCNTWATHIFYFWAPLFCQRLSAFHTAWEWEATPSGHAQVRSAQCIYATTVNFTGKYWVLSQKGQQLAQDTFQKQWWFLSLFFPSLIKTSSYLAGKIYQIQRKIYITWNSEDNVDELIPRIQ